MTIHPRLSLWPLLLLVTAACIGGCARTAPPDVDLTQRVEEVKRAELAFAATMARRDHRGFQAHVADDAIFFEGEKPIVGRERVAAAWKPFFEKPEAPFSWEPDQVSVLRGGDLALSTGPVRDPSGRIVARFNSIWRRDAEGTWRVVLDRGGPSECATQAGAP